MKKGAEVRKLKLIGGGRKDEQGRFELLFENASDAILVIDIKTGVITAANQAACELTSYLKEELIGMNFQELAPAKEKDQFRSQGISKEHLENSGFFEDLVLSSKDLYPRFVSASVKTFELERKKVAMCILRDVGEKKRMERDLITKHTELRNAYVSLEKANAELKAMQETLVQSGKLAALGELAAGIAHELNQPLTAVRGFAQEGMASISNEKAVRGCLDEVIKGSDKMQKIISHLRNFTRKSTEDFQWVDIHAVIDESMLMLDKQFRSRGIEVTKNYEKELPKIWANPFQLEQVFINLATNSRDAIEARHSGKGKIKIHTQTLSDGVLEIHFEDDGVGIPDSVRQKIFNPFFTTKEVGKGMGLGLSISYGILSRINASIMVESKPEQGTVFRIKLPVDYRKH